jgi:hypothetical protein
MRFFATWNARLLASACLVSAYGVGAVRSADQPQWGERNTRNMVSAEKALPADFDPGQRDPATGEIAFSTPKNVKWVARLGDTTYGTPIVPKIGWHNNCSAASCG